MELVLGMRMPVVLIAFGCLLVELLIVLLDIIASFGICLLLKLGFLGCGWVVCVRICYRLYVWLALIWIGWVI